MHSEDMLNLWEIASKRLSDSGERFWSKKHRPAGLQTYGLRVTRVSSGGEHILSGKKG